MKIKYLVRLIFNLLIVSYSILSLQHTGIWGCGGDSSSSSSSGGSTSSGTGSSGGSSSGGSTSSGTSSSFQIKGKLASLQVSGLRWEKDSVSGTVTDVMAVNPQAGNASCKTASVSSDGSFQIELEGKKPWYFYFFNHFNRGPDMFMGRFVTSSLHTIAPATQTGSADLGTITINSSEATATSDKSNSDILSSLSLDSSTADSLGSLDEVSRRYSNPDIDGDGEVDCSNSKSKYFLDFHVRYNMVINGQRAVVNDIIDSYLSESATTTTYTGTGIYVQYPTSFSSETTGSVKCVDSSITTSEAGLVAANTAISNVTSNSYANYNGYGPNTTNTSELPSGKIIFTFGSKTLTFSDVKTPALAQLTAPTGRIFPFVKFTKTHSGCNSSCTFSGISYKWMKKTSDGWTSASLAEISLLIKSGYLSFRLGGDANKTVGFSIPVTSVQGTISWEAANASLVGVTESEFNAVTAEQLCHFGLSHDDQLGMRYFEGLNDSSNSCSS